MSVLEQYIDEESLSQTLQYIRDNGITDKKKIKKVLNMVFIQDYSVSEATEFIKEVNP